MGEYRSTTYSRKATKRAEKTNVKDIVEVSLSAVTAKNTLGTLENNAHTMSERGELYGGYPHTTSKWPDKYGCSEAKVLVKCKGFDGILRYEVNGVWYEEAVMMPAPRLRGKQGTRTI